MLSEALRSSAAEMLLEAERTRTAMPRLTDLFDDMELGDAYAIQRAGIALREGEGAKRIGRKIGLTSRAMQAATGASEPDYGTLFDRARFANGATLDTGLFLTPRIEIELAFELHSPLEGDTVSLDDVIAATAFVVPAIEIIDARTIAPRNAARRHRR